MAADADPECPESMSSAAGWVPGRIARGLWQRGMSFVRDLLDVLEAAGDVARANALRDKLERERRQRDERELRTRHASHSSRSISVSR